MSDTGITQPSSSASGWQVWPHPSLFWNWSAYGPRGARAGLADSKDAATIAAMNMEVELCRP